MPNLEVMQRIMKEEGLIKLITESSHSLGHRIERHIKPKYYYLKSFLRKPIKNGKPGHIYIVICMDIEGPKSHAENNTWGKINVQSQFLADNFEEMPINRFIVDWVSKKDKDVKKGHHRIFDAYFTDDYPDYYWHYHHPLDSNNQPQDWKGHSYYEDIINRKIIDRHRFPAVFRAGYTYEGTIAKTWLNKWIPFDFSMRGPYQYWEDYPSDWRYLKQGNRFLFRSLDAELFSRTTPQEIEQAFKQAANGEEVIISFFTHDFKKFRGYLAYVKYLVHYTAKAYPLVDYEYSDALYAIRKILHYPDKKPLRLSMTIKDSNMIVKSNRPIYQSIPYIVYTSDKKYIHDENVKQIGPQQWSYKLNDKMKKIGIAISDQYGYTAVEVYDYEDIINKSAN